MKRARVVLLLALVALGVYLSSRAQRRWQEYRRAEEVCEATREGRWAAAVDGTDHLVDATVRGRRTAECRCVALMETDRAPECIDEMEAVLADPDSGEWLPFPLLTAVLVEARRDGGQLPEAAQLAHRGARTYPDDPVLFYLELALRGQLEEESAVLAEMEERVRRSEHPAAVEGVLRLQLANAHLDRSDWDAALAVLGDAPLDRSVRDRWYDLRAFSFAKAGRGEELRGTLSSWRADGGDEIRIRALYAYLLSMYHLEDPVRSRLDLLAEVVENADRLSDRDLLRSVWIRFVGTLAVTGFHQVALEYFDLGVEELGDMSPLDRGEILRSATRALLGEELLLASRGRIRFVVEEARLGDRLRVSPPPSTPLDEPFEEIPVPADGVVEVERSVGIAPQRWVLVDEAGGVSGSGTVWPVPDQTVETTIERRPPVAPRPGQPSPLASGDGHSRVVVVVLDCADWRLSQYARARGEMPFLDAFLRQGWRAVLLSDPPFTAAAIQALVTPQRRGVSSFFAVLHRLGTEIEALNFVGRNPVGLLGAVLPVRDDIFTALGQGELMTVNMLHAYGPLDVGRHGEVVGPGGVRGAIEGTRGHRTLTAEEAELLPTTAVLYRELLEEMAADFDALEQVVDETEADLTVLRVASLDLLTHGLFPEAVRSGQDDGEPLLIRTYGYIDRRLGALHQRLDRDDLLVVMSDHGIRTAMEHDPAAMLVVVGESVPTGRADGSPELRGVGRMLADYFGVETDWPATGIEKWLETRRATTVAGR